MEQLPTKFSRQHTGRLRTPSSQHTFGTSSQRSPRLALRPCGLGLPPPTDSSVWGQGVYAGTSGALAYLSFLSDSPHGYFLSSLPTPLPVFLPFRTGSRPVNTGTNPTQHCGSMAGIYGAPSLIIAGSASRMGHASPSEGMSSSDSLPLGESS